MSKGFTDIDTKCRQIVADARKGVFSPVYLLMGEEAYYPDMVCDTLIDTALQETERDFNQTIFYGSDADADKVVTAAMRYPVFAERQLVVIKEAQMMSALESLAAYCNRPLSTTVLVICLHGSSLDKRKGLYKAISKNGTIVDSPAIRDYEIARWISSYYQAEGLEITPDAAALLGEYAGTDLNKIVVETTKLRKNLPENVVRVSAEDIENNVGISRQFSIFELTKELSARNRAKALKIAAYIGAAPRFMLLTAIGPLFTHFHRILRYEALLLKNPHPTTDMKVKVLGVNPYFCKEYDMAAANYPVRKCMEVIALLKEYDFRGKGGDAGEASQPELLMELVAKIIG